MPEGDTVWRTARRLRRALVGRTLTASDFRLARLATVDLTGRVVEEVTAVGKHLLIRLDDARSLHTHLRMDGSWHLYPRGQPWRGGPAYEVRVVLGTAEGWAVGYRLHDVAVVRTVDEARLVGHLGPDILAADWDVAEATRRLSLDPHREIGQALLDQRHVAGIGNLYRCEALFVQGISPWRPVGDVADLPALLRTAGEMLRANRNRVEQATTGVTRRDARHWVFERHGRPCRRCGHPVRVAHRGDAAYRRLVYWCPACQPD